MFVNHRVNSKLFYDNNNFFKKRIQTGRSMIEMLAVLFIVGAVSVGSFWGFRKTISSLDASDIRVNVSQMALDASAQRLKKQRISLAEHFPDKDNKIKSKYLVSWKDHFDGDSNFFSLTVGFIPEDVCRAMLERQIFANRIELNDTLLKDASGCYETDNYFTFIYANNLDTSLKANPYNPNQDSFGDCKAGFSGEDCTEETTDCSGHGSFDILGDFAYCQCDSGYGGNNCDSECPNDKYPLLSFDMSTKEYDGGCHSCESDTWSVPASECDKCPNRNGVRFISSNPALCLPCTFPDGIPSTKAECDKCAPLRTFVSNKYCVLDACDGFRLAIGTCLPCSVQGKWETNDKEGCLKCGRDYVDGYCHEQSAS